MKDFLAIIQYVVESFNGNWGLNDLLVYGTIFFAVALLAVAVFMFVGDEDRTSQRYSEHSIENRNNLSQLSLSVSQSRTKFTKLLEALEKNFLLADEKERTLLQERMIQAGFMNPNAGRIYFFSRIVLAIGLPVGFLLWAPQIASNLSTTQILLIAAGLCAAGLYLPFRFLDSRIESRKREIMEGFPDALDMMVVSVEAGLGFDAMLHRVSDEIAHSHPTIAALIGLVNLELRAGKSREDALKNLGSRSGVQDIVNFATLMIQSEALGADIAETLRIQADEMRTLRMLRAEETAHKLPVKLAICLVSFILPCMFAVVLGPSVVSIVRDVMPHLGK